MTGRTALCSSLLLALFLSGGAAAAADEPELIVQLERSRIFEGESVLYQAVLNNVEHPERPRLPEVSGLRVEPAGERSLNSEQITIINGRMTRIQRYGMAYNWRLTPERAGTYRIPPPRVEVDGKPLPGGRTLVLEVRGPEAQDTVILEIRAEPDRVYPLQPFTVTLTVLVQALPEPYEDRNPLSVLQTPPALTVPWVYDLPPGLEPETDWRRWLGPMEASGGFFTRGVGFTINRIALTFPTDASLFDPPHRRVTRNRSDGSTGDYWAFTLARTFRCGKTGTFTFGPANLKGVFVTDLGQGGDFLGDDFYALGKPVTVTVREPPEEGRPPAYTGAIGRFTLSAKLAPKKARVGDPLTLTLRLQGEGTLDRAQPPDLASLPGVAERFKVYEATAETKGKTRIFSYGLRPLKAGIPAFPSIPLAYFDVERERYVTLKTDPIPLEIREAERLPDREILTGGTSSRPGNKPIEARKEGLFANIKDPGPLRNQAVSPGRYVAALAAMVMFYLLAALAVSRFRRLSEDQGIRRRRNAPSRARARLMQGGAALKSGRSREAIEALRKAFTGLAADTAGLPGEGLGPRDVEETLLGLGIEAGEARATRALMEAFDAARFGAPGADTEELLSQSKERLETLLRALKEKGRFR